MQTISGRVTRRRRVAIKQLLMNSHLVVGVGNIYASEALFRAGIRPQRQARSLTRVETARLVRAVRTVLRAAIRVGGTTLRDYVGADGAPGYFVRSSSSTSARGKRAGSAHAGAPPQSRAAFELLLPDLPEVSRA